MPGTDHLPAPPTTSPKGVPLPLAGRAAADVAAAPLVGVGDDAARDGLGDAGVEGISLALAASLRVVVDMAPVLIPPGPTAMGTTTMTVWPPSTTDVRVIVVCVVLVGSVGPSSRDVFCALRVGREGDESVRVDSDDPAVFEAAA
jgi:hypothetical protein